jgi:putative toxin-antitoxin system antitoxin component (TIGR02293 family)
MARVIVPYGWCSGMTQADYVLDVLGGETVFRGPRRSNPAELRARIRHGLPYRSLESVCRRLQLTLPETAAILHTSMRTLARRKRERKLQAVESDRLVRLARVAAHAVAVFRDEPTAVAWLRRPNRALGGEMPFRLLDTEVGTAQVEDVLGRIEYGIVA